MTINVIFAVNQTTWDALKKNFQYNPDGSRVREDLTNSQARKLLNNISGHWESPSILGTTYHVVSWYVPDIYVDVKDKNSGIKWVEFLLNKFPNKFHIIGAWNRDGSMFGTSLKQVKNGTDSYENRDKVITLVDTQVLDVSATIVNKIETLKTVKVEEISYVGNGTFTELPHFDTVVEGSPYYPIHSQYLKIFPSGIPEEVNRVLGWKDRRWT